MYQKAVIFRINVKTFLSKNTMKNSKKSVDRINKNNKEE